VHVGVDEVRIGNGPELPLIAEGVPGPGEEHDIHELLEVVAVDIVLGGALVPGADGADIPADAQGVHPAGLVPAHEAHAQSALQHVVESRHVLRSAHGVVGRGHPAHRVHAQPAAVLADPHGHEPGLVGDLEALDLQVVLRMAETGETGLIGDANVLRDLVQGALVELGTEAGHPGLQLGPPAHRHVHEEMEVHGPPPSHLAVEDQVTPRGRGSAARR
jgi:hypothetical protein